ncbi:hypothetical protein BH23BAC4_BH23BAC4_02170 [soil metagenome]
MQHCGSNLLPGVQKVWCGGRFLVMAGRPLITEQTVLDAARAGQKALRVPEIALVTALATDAARDRGITIEIGTPEAAPDTTSTAPRPEAPKRLAVGCDHGGFAYKAALIEHTKVLGWDVLDLGTNSEAAVDYPDYALAVALAVARGHARYGLMIDGAGVGSAMVANKVPGIRAACCGDVFSAFNARAHNDAHVLTLGSRTMGIEVCKRILSEFLQTPFEGGRHAARLQKIIDVEARFLPGPDRA